MCMMILIEDLDDYHNDKTSAKKTSHRDIDMQPSNRIKNERQYTVLSIYQ